MSGTLRMDKDTLISSINGILADKETLNKRQLESKWFTFMNTYPMIFFQIIDSDSSDLDMNIIETMVNDVTRIDNNEITNEEVELELGNTLAEKYIYTKVERPSPAELSKAYKKAIDKKYSQTTG